MADCELCGAMKVGTRAVIMGRAEVQACKRCTEKMGLAEKKVAPGLAKAVLLQVQHRGLWWHRTQEQGYYAKGEKELASDFAKRVTTARSSTWLGQT